MTPETFRITLSKAFSASQIRAVADRAIGARGLSMIDIRTRAGRFLGGSYADKPYSNRPLPLFFFGELTFRPRSVVAKSARNKTTVSFNSKEDLVWGKSRTSGKPMPFLKGGYAFYRAKTGRGGTTVNLTFTGAMLQSLQFKSAPIANGVVITYSVPSAQNDKAYYTNLKRQWLGFSPAELGTLTDAMGKEIEKGLK